MQNKLSREIGGNFKRSMNLQNHIKANRPLYLEFEGFVILGCLKLVNFLYGKEKA